jgi:hypothetical protein
MSNVAPQSLTGFLCHKQHRLVMSVDARSVRHNGGIMSLPCRSEGAARRPLIDSFIPFVLMLLAHSGCTAPAPTADPTPMPAPEPSLPLESVALQRVAMDLTSPLDLAQPDDGSGRLFIADQIGLIRVVDGAGNLLPEPLLVPFSVRDFCFLMRPPAPHVAGVCRTSNSSG